MARIAVIGGGVVGVTTALLAAAKGHRVELFESEQSLWSRASAAQEGKVHLGPIFALGDAATHRLMLEGAVSFGPLLERAVGRRLDWQGLRSSTFRYLVMPGTLATPEELSARYASLNDLAGEMTAPTYLGEALGRVVDPRIRRDDATGLPSFDTEERAVDPMLLRDLCVATLGDSDVVTHLGREVVGVQQHGGHVEIRVAGAAQTHGGFDAVVNATWERQHRFLAAGLRHSLNYRVKLAVRVEGRPGDGTVTMVQGPFGDVVKFSEYTYCSWYPVGRLIHESGRAPSASMTAVLDQIGSRSAEAVRTLEELVDVGVLEDGARVLDVIGGAITGHGALDIDAVDSGLHARSEFGVVQDGRVFTPISFKFTTAPLVAQRTVDAIGKL